MFMLKRGLAQIYADYKMNLCVLVIKNYPR